MSKLRGLAPRKPTRFALTDKQAVRSYLKALLAEQYAPGELAREGLALSALGLIPKGLDYEASMVGLYEEQVGGYYDPRREVFFLADWIAASSQEGIIAHELCHALQDQHFGLDGFIQRMRGRSDAMLARASLVEGEATLVMMLDQARGAGAEPDLSAVDLDGPFGQAMMNLSAKEYPRFAASPPALKALLMFPYLQGLRFVAMGRKRGGWKALNRAYKDLPHSTEQILHPDKFFGERDRPSPVALDWAEAVVKKDPVWELIYRDVLGEFMWSLVLGDLSKAEKRGAAAGWDGDGLRVWRRQGAEDLAWMSVSVWDSEGEAVEFAGALAKTVRFRWPGAERLPIDDLPRMRWRTSDGRMVWIQRSASRVLVVEGLPVPLCRSLSEDFARSAP